jgi:hypothetical protein
MSMLRLPLLLILSKCIIFIGYSQDNCATITPEQSVFGYKRLTNRCEGFYNPRLSGSLQVVSFIKGGNVQFVWNEKAELVVHRADNLQSSIHIRAVSLPTNTFYQMDALLDKNHSLEWPVKPYIYPRGIKPDQLGVYGWSGNEDEKIFSPVSVIEKGSTAPNNQTVVMKIRTVLDLSNFRWNLARANGPMCEPAVGTFQVFEGDMTAGTIIEIKIPQLAATEISLCLEIQYRPENKRWQSEILKIKM